MLNATVSGYPYMIFGTLLNIKHERKKNGFLLWKSCLLNEYLFLLQSMLVYNFQKAFLHV